MIELRPIPRDVELKEAFELRKDRPAIWLQRACLWILRKLGCFACVERVEYQRHEIGKKGCKFIDRLIEQREAIYGTFNHDPTRLYIGSEQFAEMMKEPASTAYFSFDAEYMKGGRYPKVMGLHVEVIPWMRGILLL